MFWAMRLKVNGDMIESGADTVLDLLEELKVSPERVAVEVNMRVLKRAEFRDFILKEGDSIEIVNFVGGGNNG